MWACSMVGVWACLFLALLLVHVGVLDGGRVGVLVPCASPIVRVGVLDGGCVGVLIVGVLIVGVIAGVRADGHFPRLQFFFSNCARYALTDAPRRLLALCTSYASLITRTRATQRALYVAVAMGVFQGLMMFWFTWGVISAMPGDPTITVDTGRPPL
jgi:hypothetical protein